MKKRKHEAPPRYDAAFKEGAIRLVTQEGRPMREVAQELGVCVDTIRNWLKASGIRHPAYRNGTAEPHESPSAGSGDGNQILAQTAGAERRGH